MIIHFFLPYSLSYFALINIYIPYLKFYYNSSSYFLYFKCIWLFWSFFFFYHFQCFSTPLFVLLIPKSAKASWYIRNVMYQFWVFKDLFISKSNSIIVIFVCVVPLYIFALCVVLNSSRILCYGFGHLKFFQRFFLSL